MSDENTNNGESGTSSPRSLFIGIALKVMVVIGIGTAIAFWSLSQI